MSKQSKANANGITNAIATQKEIAAGKISEYIHVIKMGKELRLHWYIEPPLRAFIIMSD